MPQTPIEKILSASPLSNDERADLWDAFYAQNLSDDDFSSIVDRYQRLSPDAKSRLVSMRQYGVPETPIAEGESRVGGTMALPAILSRPGASIRAIPGGFIDAAESQLETVGGLAGAAAKGVSEAFTENPSFIPTPREAIYKTVGMTMPGGPAALGVLEQVGRGIGAEMVGGVQQAMNPELTARERVAGAIGAVPIVGPMVRDIGGGLISPRPEEFGRAAGEIALGALEGAAAKAMPKLTSAAAAMDTVSAIKQKVLPVTPDEAFMKFAKPSRARTQRADFLKTMKTAREELRAGQDELGREIGAERFDQTTGQIRGPQDYEILLDAKEASQLRKNSLWDAVKKYQKRGDRLPGVKSDDIADAIATQAPETFKTSEPTRGMRRVARDFDDLQKAYRNKKDGYFTAEDIDNQITRVNAELRKYYDMPSGTRQLNPQYQLLQAERNALEKMFESTLDKGSYTEVKDLMRRFGALRQMDDAIEREYGAALAASEYGMGQAVVDVSRFRSLLRGAADVAFRRSPESVAGALGNVTASGATAEFVRASMELAKPARQLRRAMQLSKPAKPIMVTPPKVKPSIMGEPPEIAQARRDLQEIIASSDEPELTRQIATRELQRLQQQYAGLEQQGMEMMQAGIGAGDLTQMPPPRVLQSQLPAGSQASRAQTTIGMRQAELEAAMQRVKEATTKQDKAAAKQVLESLQQQYLREGAITDQPLEMPFPYGPSGVTVISEPWQSPPMRPAYTMQVPQVPAVQVPTVSIGGFNARPTGVVDPQRGVQFEYLDGPNKGLTFYLSR